jgi:glycosyltransferase involved in cell wall biosynthesis
MYKISVILTSYNHGQFIREAIESILNQSFTDFQLIIWDDASSDDSWEIITSYSDKRIKVYRNERNMRGGNINRALEVASGEYIAIHHSDDVWELDKLEKQVAYLDLHPEVGAVFTLVQIINENGENFSQVDHFYYKIFDQPNRTRHEWLRFFFVNGNALCHPSLMIRKSCYQECGSYRYGLAQLTDFDMWIRLCLKVDIYVLQEKLTKFRIRDNEVNTSGNRPEVFVRVYFEYFQLLSNYLTVSDFQELCKIFPEAEKYFRKEQTNVKFALAMIALELSPFRFTELFGLNILFELMQHPREALQIEINYQFDYGSLIRLTGVHDGLGVIALAHCEGEIAKLERALSDNDKEITILNQTLASRESSLHDKDQQIKALHCDIERLKKAESKIAEPLDLKQWQLTRLLRALGHLLKRIHLL